MSMMSELRDHTRLRTCLVHTVDGQGAQESLPEGFPLDRGSVMSGFCLCP